MIVILQITTINTGKFPNPYLVSLCTRLCWYCKWQKTGGVGPGRETMATRSELPGHEGKRRGRHCTGTGRGTAQSEGSALHRLHHTHKTKGFAEIERCAMTAHGVARGTPAASHSQCHAMRALKTSKSFMFAVGDFQHCLCYTREDKQPLPCKI